MPIPIAISVDHCPGCASAAWDAIGSPAPAVYATAGGETFVQPAYGARRCRHCGLVFKSVTATPATLERYYATVDHVLWDAPTLFPNERRLEALLHALPAGSRVLDFGCSSGRLLGRLTKHLEACGSEVNPVAAAAAAQRGLTMLPPAAVLGSTALAPFDAILLVDVIEHWSAPTALITALARHLRPGGQLLVCTADAEAPAVAGDPANFWYFRNLVHLCMITATYARHAADAAGLVLAGWERVSHYDSTVAQRLGAGYRQLAFECLHRGRWPWLRPLIRQLPGGRRAAAWTERPYANLSADHVIATFRRA